MKELNKIEIPTSVEQDYTPSKSVWKNGKLMIQRGTIQDTYYIGHETKTVTEVSEEGEETSREVTLAFPIPVNKPASYGDVINAAERQAYCLISNEAAISYIASLDRKYRENPEDSEVAEHDEFIAYVKSELAILFK